MIQKKNELRKQIKAVRWMIFWVVLAQFAAEVGIEAAFSFMDNPPHRYIRIAIIEVLSIGAPLVIYARSAWNSKGRNAKKEFWLNPCKWYLLILAAAIGVCGQFVMILLNLPMNMMFDNQKELMVSGETDAAMLVMGLMAFVIIPAILEEFWMRGIIFSAYSKSNTFAAIFFTSLIFAFLHMSITDILGFLFMGIMASLIMIKCNSLYAAMVYHAFSNLTAFLLNSIILTEMAESIWLILCLAIVVFIGLFILLLFQKNKAKINKAFKFGNVVVNSLFSWPILLSVAVALIKMLVSNGR